VIRQALATVDAIAFMERVPTEVDVVRVVGCSFIDFLFLENNTRFSGDSLLINLTLREFAPAMKRMIELQIPCRHLNEEGPERANTSQKKVYSSRAYELFPNLAIFTF
jgi:hypothetical protein